ncbi:hypothetical protein CLV62_101231 [Dysgonomonas alginatilytica]|uniref:Uncharacterized protein n=1 Tax=Dysgonomonas alginatilytica TaxID=1605892 RepID=A0A2V3Q0W2_9BACT|nr:hypothetical protein CLV62_101231 [Dysgonomonas alginatilytica]
MCVKIRTKKHVTAKNILDEIYRLSFSFLPKDASYSSCKYILNKNIDSCLGTRFRVADLFCYCRSKSARNIRLPMSQLCPVAVCSDYILLLRYFHSSNDNN